jgi:RNA polymerase sigma factor (sigma-70 family)
MKKWSSRGVFVVERRDETALMNPVGPGLLSELLDGYGPALVLYAQQWCRTPEDVVQEALVELVRQPAVPANVVGWLYRVVRNGAISASRSESRRARREEEAAVGREPWFEVPDSTSVDPKAATAALEQLPIELRETIVARLWGGLSLEQVAELTGVSLSTAWRRYRSGLAALRERLGVPCPVKKISRPN